MIAEQAMQFLDKHCNALSEHFDSVQILVSRLNSDGTTQCYSRGSGNWYARQGMAHEFIGRAQADDIGRSVAANLNDELQG